MKKSVTIMLLVLSFLLTSCAAPIAKTSSANTSNYKNGKQIVIGFANLDDSIPMCRDVRTSMISFGKTYNVKIIAVDNKSSAATAIKNVDDLITQGINVLVEFNADAAANQTIKDKCDAAKISVIGIDIPVPNSPTMGADNVGSGKMVGSALGNYAKNLWGGKIDKLLLIDFPSAGAIVKTRMDNIIVGVQEVFPDFDVNKVVRVDGQNDVLPAQKVTADFLTANPNAHHILIGTLNDLNAQGALAAIKSAGRDNDVIMVSHGCSNPAMANFWSGEDNCWKGGVAYFPEKYGDYIIPAAIKLANGESVPDYIPMKHVLITKDNIDQYYPKPVK
jgi:ribose transport system substrate-binding protein